MREGGRHDQLVSGRSDQRAVQLFTPLPVVRLVSSQLMTVVSHPWREAIHDPEHAALTVPEVAAGSTPATDMNLPSTRIDSSSISMRSPRPRSMGSPVTSHHASSRSIVFPRRASQYSVPSSTPTLCHLIVSARTSSGVTRGAPSVVQHGTTREDRADGDARFEHGTSVDVEGDRLAAEHEHAGLRIRGRLHVRAARVAGAGVEACDHEAEPCGRTPRTHRVHRCRSKAGVGLKVALTARRIPTPASRPRRACQRSPLGSAGHRSRRRPCRS